MKGFLTLLWIAAFFGLCLYGFEYVEKHDSTAQKSKIAELGGEIEELRSEITELSNKRNALKRKFLDYFPNAVNCETPEECDGNMVCDADLGVCVTPLSDPAGGPSIES